MTPDTNEASRTGPSSHGAPVEDCWSRIGVWGDHTCGELEKFIHCHNCRIFRRSGQELFARASPPNYIEEWTELLAEKHVAARAKDRSAIVFKLSSEWLALPVSLFKEAHEDLPVHRIPHRSGEVLLGLVNIRGTLELCISLHKVLQIEDLESRAEPPDARHRRLMVIETSGGRWVFPVDAVAGLHRYSDEEIESPPATLARDSRAFTRGVLAWGDGRVDLLDDELLVYYLGKDLVS